MKSTRQLYLLLAGIITCLAGSVRGQNTVPISTKELAPNFGIRPIFLDDTVHVARYLDSLGGSNSDMTDTCVSINARLMALANVMLYEYRHYQDTVWIDASHYIEDYALYAQRISTVSDYVLARAHGYIDKENRWQEDQQQTAVHRCKDTIHRQHRTITNACEGIGCSKERKKELKDIYYAYLSVYNRYDLSMKRNDNAHLARLNEFARFQSHIIDNLLSNSNYYVKINSFVNTLRIRCENGHTEVLRSFQRTFRQSVPPATFHSIDSYYQYIDTLETIIEVQHCYMDVVDLREKINATGRRIVLLYSPHAGNVAKTYQEVAATLSMTPAFSTLAGAKEFLRNLQEFTQVQDCYIQDHNRLMAIQAHGDTILKQCGIRYNDVAKAYRFTSSVNTMSPKYKTLDDAARFGMEMARFEQIQRQYDTILSLRQHIDHYKDSISKGWISHLLVYNAFQSIRKQFVLTPTFIDAAGGSDFIDHLNDYLDMAETCFLAIELSEERKALSSKISDKIRPYRNLRRAYNALENAYVTLQSINLLSELIIYINQLQAFLTVQQTVAALLEHDASDVDRQLKDVTDISITEKILGL